MKVVIDPLEMLFCPRLRRMISGELETVQITVRVTMDYFACAKHLLRAWRNR